MEQKNNFISSAGTRGYSPLARVMTLAVMMFTLATTGAWADGTVYTKAVAVSDLKQGDILAEGFSLTGSGFIAFADGRYTAVGTTYSSLNMTYYTGTGKNAVITASAFGSDYSFAPKDEKGNAGNAWLVTAKSNSDVTFAGITYAAEPGKYTVTMAENTVDKDNWTISPTEAAENTTVTATYSGTRHVKSVTAVTKAAAPAGPTTITLAAKLAYTGGEIADFTDATDDLTTMTWAVGEHIAVLYEVGGTKKVADAEITAVDGTTGEATITFTVEAGTANDTPCTLVYPLSAAKDDHSGVKDAATLLAAQDGTLNDNLDVRVGAGTIQTTTPGLTVTTQPAAQFAIFKFTTKSVPGEYGSLGNTNVTKLTVTTGGQDYVITPASATSTLYAALPAISSQAVSFTATDGSNLYAASKASVSFDAAKYYQSTVKMGKVIEVFENSDPYIDMYAGPKPYYHYLHIGLDQAYAIAKQLSTQNGGATVAVVYDDDGGIYVTYALSSDASATAHTDRYYYLLDPYHYRVFLATLWEDAD